MTSALFIEVVGFTMAIVFMGQMATADSGR
jgi:hypothetical protein